jgi:hypothetical protein
MWQAVTGIVAEIKRCEAAGATMVAVTMAFVGIDTMAFLSMPSGRSSQTREDFVAWVNTYVKGHPSQPYQYDGTDVYAARCAVLHAFGAEAEVHRRNQDIRKFGYHDGGLHAFNPAVSPNLVIIGVASFLNDVVIAVESFTKASEADANLRARVETRLPTVFQTMPFPRHGATPRPNES